MKFVAGLVALFAASANGFSVNTPVTSRVSTTSLQSTAWDIASIGRSVRIEGQSREHWEFPDPNQEIVQVCIDSNGRPVESLIELWIGPDWTPMKVKAYTEDGMMRPIQSLIGTRNKAAAIDINNTGPGDFPLNAAAAYASSQMAAQRADLLTANTGRYIEGGAVHSVNFDASVDSVQVLLYTDTRQLNAQVELLNGPNNFKQKYEVFTNNGMLNSLYVVFNTPGSGNVVRVTNLAPLEFPCKAFIASA
ncbi:predicted protein [Thalassiosira pseudonana CCMP1335]|jgi:hypothetical protein|uniref:Uncharacterized protein n=1 Tax=Thalassiosira pseudonana TaxID=35128 RepID=B8CAG8_THAPS|nr:predicted protein [Thalassiosira pseudonana CCMP1335]EED89506.1 predicted protein [Thalassiosira pseudonana CCMP1335]|eukprot:scaffold1012_cov189-Alexandrium_tamarense.AAC.9